MKDTTVYHVGVVDGNGTCYSHNAHAQLLSEISKLFSLHKVHSVMLGSISYTIKTVLRTELIEDPIYFDFWTFYALYLTQCSLINFPLTKPRKFWKVALLWFIWLLVAPQRDGKILDFYHDYLHGGLNFFRVFLWYHWFSLISLLPWKN